MYVLQTVFNGDLEKPYGQGEYGNLAIREFRDGDECGFCGVSRQTFSTYEEAEREIKRRNARGRTLGVEMSEEDIPELRRRLGLKSQEQIMAEAAIYSFLVSA